jgi:transcriptional regulator with XRE-family HTH domain
MMRSHNLEHRIGQAIRHVRLNRGFTQAALAKRARLNRTYITAVEAGKRNLSVRTLSILAEVLQTETAALFLECSNIPVSSRTVPNRRGLGSTIRTLRRIRGMSQATLADAAQFTRTYVTGVETGKRNPRLRNVARLADALGVPVAAMFDETVGRPA